MRIAADCSTNGRPCRASARAVIVCALFMMMGGGFPAIGFAEDPAVPITVEQAAGAGPGWPLRFLPVGHLLEVTSHAGGGSRWTAPMSTARINIVSLNRHGEVRLFETANWPRPGIQHGFGPYAGTRLDRFSLFHNSIALFANDALGPGWTHSGDIQIHTWREAMGTMRAAVLWGNGNVQLFERQANLYVSVDPYRDILVREFGKFVLTLKSGVILRFERVIGVPTKNVVSTIEDPNGNTMAFDYDALGRLARITDPHGRTLDLVYSAEGRLVQVVYAFGGAVRVADIGYDGGDLRTVARPFVTLLALPAGEGSRLQTSRTLATKIPGLDREVTTFFKNSLHNIVREIDALGRMTDYGYVGKRLLQVESPLGHVQRFESPAERIRELFDAINVRKTVKLDPQHRVIEVINALGASTRVEYADADYPHGASRIISPSGVVLERSWDPSGNPTSSVDPRGNVTRFEYDALNHLTRITEPLVAGQPEPGHTSYTYDGAGNLLSIGRNLGGGTERETTFTYDDRGNRVSRTDAGGATTRYSYDANGNRTGLIDALGRTFTWEFANAERTHLFTRPSAVTTGVGDHIAFHYNQYGQFVGKETATESFVYFRDLRGRLAAMIDPSGTTEWSRNADGQITVEDKIADPAADPPPAAYTVRYSYLANGRLAEIELPGAGRSIEYLYDAVNRLQRVIDGENVRYIYDDDSRIVRVEYSNGTSTTQEYDEGLLTRIQHFDGTGVPFVEYRFGYDEAARLVRASELAGETRFSFSLAGDLIGEVRSSGSGAPVPDYSFFWDIDAAGDRLSEQKAIGTATDLKVFLHDTDGRPLATSSASGSESFTWDGNGSLIEIVAPGLPPVRFVYGAQNELALFEQGEFALRNFYDGLGRKVAQEITEGGTVVESRQFLYAGNAVVQERTDDDDVVDITLVAVGGVALQMVNGIPGFPHQGPLGFNRHYTGADGNVLSAGEPVRNGYGDPVGSAFLSAFPYISYGQVTRVTAGADNLLEGPGFVHDTSLARDAAVVGAYVNGRRTPAARIDALRADNSRRFRSTKGLDVSEPEFNRPLILQFADDLGRSSVTRRDYIDVVRSPSDFDPIR